MDNISEKIFVDINGVKQGMFIKSMDAAHPVLLNLHGGLPEYFLTYKYPTGLEKYFTVVWWEQRGAGISYNPSLARDCLSVEQLISDTTELTNYLRHRFDQEKIYLLGHSHGSFFGIQAAAKKPELYHAYIGEAQMSNQQKSEVEAYEYMLDQFRAKGDRRMVRRLEAVPVTGSNGTPAGYLALRDEAMHKLGIGTTRDMKSVVTGIFLPSILCPEYTMGEKIKLWQAKIRFGVSFMWDQMLVTDLAEVVSELHLPIYFLHGIHDYTCSYTGARSYLEQLKAPLKGFYSFENSAHSPIFEEPKKTLRILLEDVLAGTNDLADVK